MKHERFHDKPSLSLIIYTEERMVHDNEAWKGMTAESRKVMVMMMEMISRELLLPLATLLVP